jgi:hypothetical protein
MGYKFERLTWVYKVHPGLLGFFFFEVFFLISSTNILLLFFVFLWDFFMVLKETRVNLDFFLPLLNLAFLKGFYFLIKLN